MNVERLKAEAERLLNWDKVNPDISFNMQEFYLKDDACGTCCCIAGDITLTHGEDLLDCYVFAKDYLDLNNEQANWLFFGHFSDAILLEDITPEEAADAIDALIANPNIGDDID